MTQKSFSQRKVAMNSCKIGSVVWLVQRNASTIEPAPARPGLRFLASARPIFAVTLSLAFLVLASTLQAQLTISDDFNDGNDVGWTAYEGSPGTREVQFPSGGYRIINHAPFDESGIFTRGGSIRNDATYVDQFFVAADVVTWDDKAMIGLAGTFLMAKAQTPGSLSTFGYLTLYAFGGPLAPQGLMAFIEFQSELTA